MTYTGEHGPQIKQLIQTHMLRRVSMCCLATKRRKHLIVTHEKGKSSHFTILQLNALLKQDSNKRNKLTLTKLNTISVPFTLISAVANQYNEDYMALTGLKDCYVMYLNENGQTRQEIIQQNQLQTQPTQPAAATATSTSSTTAATTATTTTTNTAAASSGPSVTTNTNTNANDTKSSQQTDPIVGANSSGLIILHPSLEGSNFIIKAIWLPGSQTELALITSEFVKIYDLSIDKISPIYYFVLPMGKIKDATFVYNLNRNDEQSTNASSSDSLVNEISSFKLNKSIVIMSSFGFLYHEEMNDLTSAKNGVYYITNTIDFDFNEELIGKENLNTDTKVTPLPPPPPPPPPPSLLPSSTKAQSSTTAATAATSPFGSGVSVYYSFKLQLLFWSYQQGKSFMGVFKSNKLILDKVSLLNMNSAKANTTTSTTTATNASISFSSQQALCNWSEIQTHPGLVMAMTLLSNNPVILMFLPDKIYFQEIKLTNNQGGPSKAKIQDMVATRHPSSSSSSSASVASASTITSTNEEDDNGDANEMVSQKKENFSGLPVTNSEKTTMIILCDDGSLKIYVADSEKTEYWLKPHLQPTNPIMQLKAPLVWSSACLFQLSPSNILDKKNKIITATLPSANVTSTQATASKVQEPITSTEPEATATSSANSFKTSKNGQLKRTNAVRNKFYSIKQGNSATSTATSSTTTTPQPTAQINFPIDYFEKCTQISDIEYGGNDLLEIYNTQQLKSRLTLGGNKFVVSMRSQGIKLEISNTVDSTRTLLMGCRILIGTHSIERAPAFFEVFDRRIPVKLTRSRWFDICLTREEAFIADNKLTILIGSSVDPRFITVVDACVCYGKPKDQLNWNKAEVQTLQKKYNQAKLASTNQANNIKGSKTGKQSVASIDALSEQKHKQTDKKTSICERQDINNM